MVDQTSDRTISDTDQGPSTQNPGGRFAGDREGFANHPHLSPGEDTAAIGDLPADRSAATTSDSIASRIASSATSPWLQIGLIGVGGLLLGYFAGKSFTGSSFGSAFGRFAADTDDDEFE